MLGSSMRVQSHPFGDDALSQDSQHFASTIPLHVLCKSCAEFCGRWEILNRLQQPASISVSTWPVARLCTIGHLVTNRISCHFCNLLLASLQRPHNNKAGIEPDISLNVYLHPQESAGMDLYLHVKVAEETPQDGSRNKLFANLILKTHHFSEVGGFDQHVTARSIPLLARDNLERAKSWIDTCLSKHTECLEFHHNTVQQDNRRPTRVLEVAPSNIKLSCDMADQRFDYLALSHMWGDASNQHLKLKVSNLSDFQKLIPWDSLSFVYQEAVRVTLALGYRYLWIDSLCIIQDSPGDEDWNYEARLMATVYGNAICNLAFIFPNSTPESMPARCDPRDWNPCILREATTTHSGVSVQHHTSLLRQTYQITEDKDWLVQRNWPLFSRAWTFQEYLLAPRTLLLGHKNLMFQCSRYFYDELLGPIASPPRGPIDTTPKRGRDLSKTRYFPPSLKEFNMEYVSMSHPIAINFAIDWQALVNEYLARELTKPADRIIAIAGIARAFANLGSLTYLAGCWAEYFPLTILWYVDRKKAATIRRAGPGVMRGGTIEYPITVREEVANEVPSWSPFAVPIYTHHQMYFMFGDDEIFLRCKSLGSPPGVWWSDIYWTDLSSIASREEVVDGFPPSGFFEFGGLEVELEILILPVRVSWLKDLGDRFDSIRMRDDADKELLWDPEFRYYPDEPLEDDNQEASPPRHGVLALVAEFQICRVAGKHNIQRRLAGLVLVRAEKVGAWKRVGAWKLKIKVSNVDVNESNFGDVAKRWEKYRIWNVDKKWKMVTIALV